MESLRGVAARSSGTTHGVNGHRSGFSGRWMKTTSRGTPMQRKSTITTRQDGSVTILRMSGEIDAALRDQASHALGTALTIGFPVVLDLQDVRFIDSSGIAFLLQCHRSCAQIGLTCSVRNLPEQVEAVLTLLGMREVLHVEPRRADAER